MKAITIIKSDDGSLSVQCSRHLAPYEVTELMHEAMELLSRPRYANGNDWAEYKRRATNE